MATIEKEEDKNGNFGKCWKPNYEWKWGFVSKKKVVGQGWETREHAEIEWKSYIRSKTCKN